MRKHRGIRDPGKTPTPTAAPVWALQRRRFIRQKIGVSATEEKLQLLLRRLSGRETTTKHRGIRDRGETPTPTAAPVWARNYDKT